MDNIIDFIKKKRMQKVIRKHGEQNFRKTISLKKWCEKYGNLDRYDWIIKEILDVVDEDEKYEEYIYLNEDLEISLDENGIFIFSEILISFFGKEEVLNVHRYVQQENYFVNEIYEPVQQMIKTVDDDCILNAYNNWKEWFSENKSKIDMLNDERKDIIYETFSNIKKEVKKRKLI